MTFQWFARIYQEKHKDRKREVWYFQVYILLKRILRSYQCCPWLVCLTWNTWVHSSLGLGLYWTGLRQTHIKINTMHFYAQFQPNERFLTFNSLNSLTHLLNPLSIILILLFCPHNFDTDQCFKHNFFKATYW